MKNVSLQLKVIVNMMKNLYIVIIFSVMPSLILAQNGGVNSTVSKKDTQNKEKIVTGKSSDYNKIRYKNGDVYEGEFVKGKRQGEGTYFFSDGEKYSGQWFQDQQHGRGVFTFKNGNVYEVFGIKTISKVMV